MCDSNVCQSQNSKLVVLEKIGEGSFSSVFKVRRLNDGKIYALKKVKLRSLKPKEKLATLNQISILASLKSQKIVGFREAFVEGPEQDLCIVLQWANEGDVLADISRRKKENNWFPQSQIWRAAIEILQGLHILHSHSILHRDIKSANILKSDGVYKLGDFNISKISSGLVYTQTGTPYYASPEVWQESPYSFKSDIWSFGCVIYEMCQLEPPFIGKGMDALFQHVTTGFRRPISSRYSSNLSTLIDGCLQISVNKRFTCVEILQSPWLREKANEYNILLPRVDKIPKMTITEKKSLTKSNDDGVNLPLPSYDVNLQGRNHKFLVLPTRSAHSKIRPQSQKARSHTQASAEKLHQGDNFCEQMLMSISNRRAQNAYLLPNKYLGHRLGKGLTPFANLKENKKYYPGKEQGVQSYNHLLSLKNISNSSYIRQSPKCDRSMENKWNLVRCVRAQQAKIKCYGQEFGYAEELPRIREILYGARRTHKLGSDQPTRISGQPTRISGQPTRI